MELIYVHEVTELGLSADISSYNDPNKHDKDSLFCLALQKRSNPIILSVSFKLIHFIAFHNTVCANKWSAQLWSDLLSQQSNPKLIDKIHLFTVDKMPFC